MKNRTSISLNRMNRLVNSRIQLFNKSFYVVNNGVAIRQFSSVEQGKIVFTTFGKPVPIESIFTQIKFIFALDGRLLASRIATTEPLFATKGSQLEIKKLSKRENHLKKLDKQVRLILALEEIEWTHEIQKYWYDKSKSLS